MKELIYDFTREELAQKLPKAFQAGQIFGWLYKKYAPNFTSMNNLSKELRANLEEMFQLTALTIANIEEAKDGTKKYLFELHDGHTIETVWIKMREKELDEEGLPLKSEQFTVCVSSQVGCKVGCAFCLTAKGGFIRNLSAGEIVAQVLATRADNGIPENKSVNVVYMGMGEPLDNFDAVLKAIDIISDENGLSISPRRQTLSTSGISPKIEKLGELNPHVQLAISLHAVDNNTRTALIPMNKAYSIENILAVLKKFPLQRRRRFMFEYLVMAGLNDKLEHAKKLASLLGSFKAKVNLISFNPHEGSPFGRPSRQSLEAFRAVLHNKGITCTIRESKGLEISAACGQLRERQK